MHTDIRGMFEVKQKGYAVAAFIPLSPIEAERNLREPQLFHYREQYRLGARGGHWRWALIWTSLSGGPVRGAYVRQDIAIWE